MSPPPLSRQAVESSFRGFAAAWNSAFKSGFVKRWECQDIPEEYLSIKMNHQAKLVFCLALEKDEGNMIQ